MGKLYETAGIIVRVYGNDHLPFHFHIVAADFDCMVDIRTMAIMKGTLPASSRRQVWPWIEANRAAIVAEWNRINPRFPIAEKDEL